MIKRNSGKIAIYENKNGDVELRADIKNDTSWATQAQIAQLFETTPQNITVHINKIYRSKELDMRATCKEYLQVQKEGNRAIQRKSLCYNLDVMLAVGYRVNSKKATGFRIWATRILRDYLVSGFNLNQRKLVISEKSLGDLHKALDFLESKSKKPLKARIRLSLSKDLI